MDEITQRVGDEGSFRPCPLPCPLLAAIRELTVASDSELSEYSSSTYTSD